MSQMFKKIFKVKDPRKLLRFVFIIFLLFFALIFSSPGIPYLKIGNWEIGKKISELKINLGLDLQGGTYLVYRADLTHIEPENYTDSLEGVRDVIERRVNAFGVAEPLVQTSSSGSEYKVIVELAGIKDVSRAIAMIGETPTLDFRETHPVEEAKLSDDKKKLIQEENSKKFEQAKNILELAKKGEKSFPDLAKEFSEDPSAGENSGDLGFFKKGVMTREFEEIVFKDEFKKDQVWPDLIKTNFGYHIIKKTDEKGEGENREIRASHILFITKDEEYDENLLYQEPYKLTGLTGKQLERADVGFDPNTGEPQVSLSFNDEGKELFREITQRNLGKTVPVFLDGEMITNPVIQAIISDGKAVITGNFTLEEAKTLERRLNEGALPVPISLVHEQTIGASLGQESLSKSLIAGLIGFSIVAFFMIAIYRWPGIIAVLALTIYTLLLVSVFKVLGITLTLSGIAGLILSVGMAVDANILIFERIREELLAKKRKSIAISEGFKRAWPSIRDGNASTIITCFVLIFLGTGMVRGFATALVLGIFLSMFTAIFVTKIILELTVNEKEGKNWWWGVKNQEPGTRN